MCALALSRCPDIEIEIYEAASQLAEVGAGFGIFPRMIVFALPNTYTQSGPRSMANIEMARCGPGSAQDCRYET